MPRVTPEFSDDEVNFGAPHNGREVIGVSQHRLSNHEVRKPLPPLPGRQNSPAKKKKGSRR